MSRGFKKGYIPWNKGKKCPEISEALKGKIPWNKIGLTNICFCGNIFNVKQSEIKKGKGKYCSKSCYFNSKKNISSWSKGTKGIFKANSGSFKKGQTPWNYQGISPQTKLQRDKFRKTIQKEILERDNYTCQMCGERGGDLHVDHIQPWAEYVEGRFNMNNCRTLCIACHYLITFGKAMPKNSNWGKALRGGYNNVG